MGFRFCNLSSIYRASISRASPDAADEILCHGRVIQRRFRSRLQDPSFSSYYYVPRRWHLGHSHHDHDHRRFSAGEEGERIFRLGLAADVCLATGKAVTGYLSGSTAIIADAAHSVSDVVLSGVALWSYKAANVPKDKDHPYGHGKFETLGALGISCMLLATAGGIAWHALDLLLGLLSATPEIVNHSVLNEHVNNHHHGGHHHGIDMEHPILALSMAVISISTKESLYWITKRAGERQGSGLMKANAWHHRSDAISSVVALIGVGGSILGIKFLDPLAGLVVSGMIFKAGLETGYQSILELVDAAIPAEELDLMKKTILNVKGVKGCHQLRGRRAGSSLYLDVHIEVDPLVSVSAAHGVGETVRHRIYECHPEVTEVFIHIDPSTSQFSPTKVDEQELSKGLVVPSRNNCVDGKAIETVVQNAVSSKLPKQMVVERITHHVLQGKVLLEVEVSMTPEMLIRDAMEVAKEAEEEVLKTDPNIVHVSFQLRLGRRIPHFDDDFEERNQEAKY